MIVYCDNDIINKNFDLDELTIIIVWYTCVCIKYCKETKFLMKMIKLADNDLKLSLNIEE